MSETARATKNQGWSAGHIGPITENLFAHAVEMRRIVEALPQDIKERANGHLNGMFAEIERVDGLERAVLARR